MAENTSYSFDQDPVQPELSLHSAGQLPIAETTQHVDYPHGRPFTVDFREEVRVVLRSQIENHKHNMESKIQDLSTEIAHRDLEVKRARLDKDKALEQIEVLKTKTELGQRERNVEKDEHAQELRRNNEEILRLEKHNKELEDEVAKLTEEKEKLNECVQDLTHKVQTLQHKLENMENHRETVEQELKEMKDTIASQAASHKCNHQAEMDKALKESEDRTLEQVVAMLSALNTGNGGLSEQAGLQIGLLQSTFPKLPTDYKSGSSKSSISPNNSNPSSNPSSKHSSNPSSKHSSKHSTPPLRSSPPIPGQSGDQQQARGDRTPPKDDH